MTPGPCPALMVLAKRLGVRPHPGNDAGGGPSWSVRGRDWSISEYVEGPDKSALLWLRLCVTDGEVGEAITIVLPHEAILEELRDDAPEPEVSEIPAAEKETGRLLREAVAARLLRGQHYYHKVVSIQLRHGVWFLEVSRQERYRPNDQIFCDVVSQSLPNIPHVVLMVDAPESVVEFDDEGMM